MVCPDVISETRQLVLDGVVKLAKEYASDVKCERTDAYSEYVWEYSEVNIIFESRDESWDVWEDEMSASERARCEECLRRWVKDYLVCEDATSREMIWDRVLWECVSERALLES